MHSEVNMLVNRYKELVSAKCNDIHIITLDGAIYTIRGDVSKHG